MGKNLSENLSELLIKLSRREGNRVNDNEVFDILKESASYANRIANDCKLGDLSSNGVSAYIHILQKYFNHVNADIRIFCEGQYCTMLEKIVRTGSPLAIDWALSLVIHHLDELKSGRHVVFLLPLINHLLVMKPLRKSGMKKDKNRVSNKLVTCFQKTLKLNEAIVHQAIMDNFLNIFINIYPDTLFVEKLIETVFDILFTSSGSQMRALSNILSTICNVQKKFIKLIIKNILNVIIDDASKSGKPPIGSLVALKTILKYLDFNQFEEKLRKVYEIVLALITKSTIDISFAAFSLLEEFLMLIPSDFNKAVVAHYFNTDLLNSSEVLSETKSKDMEAKEEILDPLLNPLEYEIAKNESESLIRKIDLQLPYQNTLYQCQTSSLSVYAVALVSKTFLLTGKKGVVKNSSESKDSMKILSIDCIKVVAKRFGLENLKILFGDRFQMINDIQSFVFHEDNTLFRKTIQLLPLLISNNNLNEFEVSIEKIIQSDDLSRKSILIETFSDNNIRKINQLKCLKSFIDNGILFCKSNAADKRVIGSHFLSSCVSLKDHKNEKYCHIDSDIKKMLIETLCGIKESSTISSLLENIVRVYRLDVQEEIISPPVCLNMRSNPDFTFPIKLRNGDARNERFGNIPELLEHLNYFVNCGKLDKGTFYTILQQLTKYFPYDLLAEHGISIDEFLEILMNQKLKKEHLFSLIDIYSIKQHVEWVSSLSCRNENFHTNIQSGLVFGEKFLNLLVIICKETEQGRKQFGDQQNSDYGLFTSQIRNLLHIIPNMPDEIEISEQCGGLVSLMGIYGDVKGAYENYKVTMNKLSSQKFFDFIEKASLVICSCLEYIPNLELQQIKMLIQLSEYVVNISPSPSLRILHQVIKVIFGRNLGRIDSKRALNDIKETEFLKNWNFVKIVNQVSNDNIFCRNIIQLWFGLMRNSCNEKPNNLNKEFYASLEILEKSISSAIRIFRIRGSAEKLQVILIICELVSNGLHHDSVDPKGFVYEEMNCYLSDPANCTHPELLPAMMQLMIILVRIKVREKDELMKYIKNLLDIHQITDVGLIKNSINAATIAVAECILREYDITTISGVLCNITKKGLNIAANEILLLWFVTLSHPIWTENMRNTLNDHLKSEYYEWMNEDQSQEITIFNIITSLSKLDELNLDLIKKKNVKTAALVISCLSKCEVIEDALKYKIERIFQAAHGDNVSYNFLINELILSKKSHFNTEIIEKNEKPLKHQRYSNLMNRMKQKQLQLDRDNRFQMIESETPSLVNLLSEISRKNLKGFKAVAMDIVKLDIDELWNVCQNLFQYFDSDRFWKVLCNEFRHQIFAAEQLSTVEGLSDSILEVKELLSKYQAIVDRAIELFQNEVDEEQLIKLMANSEELKVNLDELTNDNIRTILSLATRAICEKNMDSYLLKGIRNIISNESIIKMVKVAPLKTLQSYIEMLKSIVTNCHSSELNNMTNYIQFHISPKLSQCNFIGGNIEDVLKSAFICALSVISKHSKIIDVEKKKCISALLRHPILYSFAMVFKDILSEEKILKIEVNSSGHIIFPLPKVHQLCSYTILQHFQQKLATIGWISRQHFDEICVSLLGVLSTTPIGNELNQLDQETCHERIQYCALAVKIFTSVLMMSLKFPLNGDPNSRFILTYRELNGPFFSSMEYKEMSILKSLFKGQPKNVFCQNIERWELNDERNGSSEYYGLCQLSLLSIWAINGVIRSETDSSVPKISKIGLRPSISSYLLEHSSDLDTVSNVKSIMSFFSHWLAHGIDAMPITLLSSVISCLQYLSDFFDETEHFRFVFQQMRIACSSEHLRGMSCEGVAIGLILKSISIIGYEEMDSIKNSADKQKIIFEWVATGLSSTVRAHVVQTLGGFIYLMQSMVLDVMSRVIDYVSKYLLNKLLDLCQEDTFDDFTTFILSASFEMLKLPSEYCTNRDKLEKSIFELFFKCIDREKENLFVEGIEQLICHSGGFALTFLKNYNDIIKSSIDLKTESYIRLYLSVIMRCAADGSIIPSKNTEEISKFLYESWPIIYLDHQDSEWYRKTVSYLLLKINGVESTMKKIFSSFDNCIECNSNSNSCVILFLEVLLNVRSRKSWGRELRKCKGWIVSRIMQLKDLNLSLFQVFALALSQRKEVYLKIHLMIPFETVQYDIADLCDKCIAEFKDDYPVMPN